MKRTARQTNSGKEVTALILEVFRLNGCLLASGDRLVADLGLTSARWQVLGAIALASSAETVARLARTMGLRRQGVQRIVNELAAEGFVVWRPNPHHRRAKLVVLTDKGRDAVDSAQARQIPWAKALARGLQADDINAAAGLLEALRRRLEGELGYEAAR
jgi:DNA-binding MarR family transcriptional regulator